MLRVEFGLEVIWVFGDYFGCRLCHGGGFSLEGSSSRGDYFWSCLAQEFVLLQSLTRCKVVFAWNLTSCPADCLKSTGTRFQLAQSQVSLSFDSKVGWKSTKSWLKQEDFCHYSSSWLAGPIVYVARGPKKILKINYITTTRAEFSVI